MREFFMRRLSVFWRTFLLMLGLTILMFVALDCSSHTAEQTLLKNYLRQAQTALERNCQTLQTTLYNTYAIPGAIEDSEYFNYIRTENSGTLPQKYVSVLPAIRKALSNQLYLQGTNEECILYFAGPGCICTRKKVFPQAPNCFDSYITFSELDREVIMQLLRQKNSLLLLPAQQVQIGSGTPQTCLTLIVRPRGSSVAVMSIYRQQTILEYFGMPDFPDGTVLTIENTQGETLLRYPQEAADAADAHSICVDVPVLGCTVTLRLPQNYFETQLRPSRQMNLLLTVLFCLLGVFCSILLSKAAVQPIANLVSACSDQQEALKGQNEIQYLTGVLEYAKQESLALQGLLLSNLFSRVFSGAVLTAEEETQLRHQLGSLADGYRIAVIHTGTACSQLQFSRQLRQLLPEDSVCQPIGLTQTGLILPDEEQTLHELEQALTQLSAQQEQLLPACGVSAAMHTLSDLHIAVRQARLAFPENGLIGIYSGSAARRTAFSWLQHERLYQSVLSADEEGCLQLLQAICKETNRVEAARETFYNVLFVLRSAAGELELLMQQALHAEYDLSIPPQENLRRLEGLARQLFAGLRQKQSLQQDDVARQVLEHLERNYAQPEICAASVAQTFGLSEKRVYTMVRRLTDMSFSDYLLQLRMRAAAELLCTTSLGAADIAARCGYQAVNTFYRAFKKYYDMTPSQLRKNGGVCEDG